MARSRAPKQTSHAGRNNDASDPIAAARVRFRDINAYRATIRSHRGDGVDVIRYAYKRPGFVRIDCITPHAGVVLVRAPNARHVRVWPLGSTLLPPLKLRPDNPLIRSPSGQRIDRSDIGAILDAVIVLQRDGHTEVLVHEAEMMHVRVTGGPRTVAGDVHRCELWLDLVSGLPTEVTNYASNGDRVENLVIDELEINPDLPASLFDP
jgi:outer membrane lipoprotein-sorting protein